MKAPVIMAKDKDRLSLGDCLGFGVGTVGVSVMQQTVTAFFPALMTTVLGQSAALAGLLMAGSKFYDAFADMIIGTASDRTHTRIGRRRPFFLFGAVISALSLLMIFLPPPLQGLLLVSYMGLAMVIYSTGYSLFSVPYLAMAGEMTDDYHERTRLLSFRVFFISVGQMSAIAGTAWLVNHYGRGSHGYAVMGMVMAAITGGAMLASFLGTANARYAERSVKSQIPFRERMRLLAGNRPLVLLLGSKFAQYVSIAVASTTKILFMLNVLKMGYEGVIQLSVAQNIAQGLAMPLWLIIARRIGKKPSLILAILILAATYLSWVWTGPGLPMTSVWARGVFAGIGGGGMVLMGVSMLPDAMELDRKRTGIRREGAFSGLYAVVEKSGYAVGPAIIGAYLAWAHYLPTKQGQLVVQPVSAQHALYAGAAVIPAVLLLISLLLILGYNLNEQSLGEAKAAGDPVPAAPAV
jgi:GPH family glycoside/pentoside/hexuronide:cation symporter